MTRLTKIVRRTPIHRVASMTVLATLALGSASAWADAGFSEEAAAEALYREGATLFDDGKTKEACAKFEASQQLDPALGTTLRLADCYDRIGKTASAWATFQRAAAMAGKQDQPDREAIANERAADLFARLSYLTLEVSEQTASLPGVEITLNGASIPKGTWGTPIPVDPGSQTLVVRAPGYEQWSQSIDISAATTARSTSVPALAKRRPESAEAAPASTTTLRDQSEPPREESSSAQQALAYVSGGLGLAALGVGGYFAYRAYKLDQDSLDHCLENEPNACTSRGRDLRDDARKRGNWATIAGAGGLALVGLSVVLFATSPSEAETASGESLRLTADVGSGHVAFDLGGTW